MLALPLLLLMAASPHRRPGPLALHGPQFGPPLPPNPYDLCELATMGARTKAIPEMLLPAIARVESGRLDPGTGRVRPWPWTINVEGVGSFFETKEAAIAAVQAIQARGQRSVDVGCMQVNLFFHPTAFATLDDAFDPPHNAAYAASFLTALYGMTKDWNLATAAYHSQTQERGEDYQRRVFGRVMTPMGPPIIKPGEAFGAIPPAGAMFGAFQSPQLSFGAIPSDASKFGAFTPLAQQPAFAAGPPARSGRR